MYDIKEEEKLEMENIFVQQYKSGDLSQFSYYVESEGECVIIDPLRDVDVYLKLIEQRQTTLRYVIETHFHADFVSGHLELNRKAGVRIIYGANADCKFDVIKVKEGDEIRLGNNSKLIVMDTPGHTKESISLVLHYKDSPTAIFTGDCMFLGEVGRPDLSVEDNSTMKDLASILYDSIQKIKNLPDEVIVFPSHGAGSHCGFNISKGSKDTLGNQKKSNYALADMSRSDFVAKVTSHVTEPPAYYFQDVAINKSGYESIDKVLSKSLNVFSPEDFTKLLNEDLVVIDGRSIEEALKSFVVGSYIISMKIPFAVWVAKLFSMDQKFVLIVDPGKEAEAIVRISRVGYEGVIGYLDGGFQAFQEFCKTKKLTEKYITSVELIADNEVKHVATDSEKYALLDIRDESEWQSTGVAANSHQIALKDLEKNISYLNAEERKDKHWAVYCKTGGRSAVAASILKKYGYNAAYLKGMDYLKEHGVDFIPSKGHSSISS